jgi:hydroxymethylpyrimidine/phosphomethylpyrimidine kinase
MAVAKKQHRVIPKATLSNARQLGLFGGSGKERLMEANQRCVSVLSIAGSDSGGGAGIQADLKSFMAMGVHGLTAIAALTAQNTRGVTSVWVPPCEFLTQQIYCLLEDFDVRAIKIGMLADAERIRSVDYALRDFTRPVVLDPVMIASSGASLLEDTAISHLQSRLVPRATLLTPNLPEAEVLAGFRIDGRNDLMRAASVLLERGVQAVLMKGGHFDEGQEVVDRLFVDGVVHEFRHCRLSLSPHGTGCSLSSAIAAGLAKNLTLLDAVTEGIAFLHRALQSAYRPGLGDLVVLNHAVAKHH